jgi:hypothetical protein
MDDEDRMGKERREVRRKTGAVSLLSEMMMQATCDLGFVDH